MDCACSFILDMCSVCTDLMSEFHFDKTKRSIRVLGCCTQPGKRLCLKTEMGTTHM